MLVRACGCAWSPHGKAEGRGVTPALGPSTGCVVGCDWISLALCHEILALKARFLAYVGFLTLHPAVWEDRSIVPRPPYVHPKGFQLCGQSGAGGDCRNHKGDTLNESKHGSGIKPTQEPTVSNQGLLFSKHSKLESRY